MRAVKLPEPYEPVVILWEDCVARPEQHETIGGAMKAYVPFVRKSIGFYVGQTEQVLVIATDDDRANNAAVASCSYIPAGMVRGIERITLPPKK